jgi:hypothetical protein
MARHPDHTSATPVASVEGTDAIECISHMENTNVSRLPMLQIILKKIWHSISRKKKRKIQNLLILNSSCSWFDPHL